jgi:hypothetical protein
VTVVRCKPSRIYPAGDAHRRRKLRQRSAVRLDGNAAAATVIRRKRAVFYNVLDMAASGKGRKLARNPLDSVRKNGG